MRISFYIIIPCSFIIGNAYAGQKDSNCKTQSIKWQLESKPKFKISERRILKKPTKKINSEIENEVSNFSMEELRLGAQKIPDKSEIQYFKSQCRYAFMSDKDVIENKCDVKKVSIPE